MHTASPPIDYDLPETRRLKEKIIQLRKDGLPVYFTQDAGPNVKIMFLEKDKKAVLSQFQ